MRRSSRSSCAAAPNARGGWPPKPCRTCASAWEWAPHVRAGRYGESMSVAALELDLEVFTGPFDLLLTLVLRAEAALLELKSRLMLLGDEQEEAVELEPEAAAEELLARMLDAHRFRAAAAYLG